MAFNKLDFNTSHVTVYPCHPDLCSRSIHISIHLMLRFIVTKLDHRKVETNFNTSHVTVYLCRCVCWLWPDNISIHLMLRFIYLADYNKGLAIKFQYISCYGLSRWEPYVSRKMGISIHLMLRFIIPIPGKLIHNRPFQYISCYGLSHLSNKCLSRPYSFQYISCYGLSG